MEHDRLLDAVRIAWCSELGQSPSPTTTWQHAGGDSIRVMSFLLELEKTIGRRVPLECLSSEMTPKSLARDLATVFRNETENIDRGTENRPLVFFIGADYPGSARFRAELKDHVRFVVIDLPSLRELVEKSFKTIVDDTLKTILEINDSDSYFLAGESFGGFIAWETSRRLIESGRRVKFVGLLDSRDPNLIASFAPPRAPIEIIRDIFLHPKPTILTFTCEFFERAPLSLVNIMRRAIELLPPRKVVGLNYRINIAIRSRVLRTLVLRPLLVPTVLFRSAEFLLESPDYGWSALCPQLSIVQIGGGHVFVNEERPRDALRKKFLESVTNVDSNLIELARH